MTYPHEQIDAKWQKRWEEAGVFRAHGPGSGRPKFYGLVEFPYPSGAGLHVGHPRSYVAMDVITRKRRMQGYDVLYPIGWDAFGLPTENFAIKSGRHPAGITAENIAHFRRQLCAIGLGFDWSREVDTTDPGYFRWTQWMFLKFFDRGLAYKAEVPVNWCTSCQVGLAHEEVVDGVCERCQGEVVQKLKEQWMLRITAYAERLLEDLETVDYQERIRVQQRDWIGRSEGAEIDFPVDAGAQADAAKLTVYTTRPDTLFGATYMVLAPEHPLIEQLGDRIENRDQVQAYAETAARKGQLQRRADTRQKTGVPLRGLFARNPFTGERIPLWTSDYVLMGYGTGAIMAVPGHDQRDWEFARTFDLPIVEVVAGGDVSTAAYTDNTAGRLVNSSFLDGLSVPDAIATMCDRLEAAGAGRRRTEYHLRDWVFSRQRYWGEPIPLVHCAKDGWVPLPESELPLRLPEVERVPTSAEGRSPLAEIPGWVHTTCPRCGGPAERETDTMPQWAGSSWYFLRYCDPHDHEAFASPEALDYWLPIDWYNGGMEHTTLHLLYSRFWHKALYDIGVVPTPEPYARRTSHGMILGEGSEKMSKARGNVIDPMVVLAEHGADGLRVYEMFMGAFDQMIPWSTQNIAGVDRFLDRVAALVERVTPGAAPSPALEHPLHRTIQKVSEDIEAMKFNTALSALMVLANELQGAPELSPDDLDVFLRLLYPFAPHLCEELHEQLGRTELLALRPWPDFDPDKARGETLELVVQVNGKRRDAIEVQVDIDEPAAIEAALASERIRTFVEGRTIRRKIYVPGRLVNLVVS